MHYGHLKWWPADTPFEMMVGAILTQNTNWKNVVKAIDNFEGQLSPQFIQEIPIDDLAQLIRPSGYYNQKAKVIKALATWFEKYNFDIEEAQKPDGESLRKELLDIKGVGPETADSILSYALDKTYFVIDTYTRRILSRYGIDIPKSYDDLRLMIEKAIPKDILTYQQYHALIVEHAKEHCIKKPTCEACPLAKNCQYPLNF